jgi:hypothetical protein
MDKIVAGLGVLIIVLAAALGLAMLMAYPTMWLMNYLFTAQVLTFLFGAAKITFWKAFAFNTLFSGLVSSGYSSSKSK